MNELIKLIKKIHSAILEMMKAVVFAEDGHTYKNVTTGEWLQGVSEVSSIVPKDWLSAWGAKECSKFLGYSDYEGDTDRAKLMMETIKECQTTEEYIAILKDAKGASRRKSKEALVDGKAGHLWLENYVKAKIRNTEIPEMPKGNLERPLKQFVEWAEKEVKIWVLSEARVAYPAKNYAGTLDGLAIMNNDKLAVIDFKFAGHFSSDYKLQTAGYQATFEPYDIKVDERIIIRLPKTIEKEEWNKDERKYQKVPNNIEIMILDKDYELDRDAFFHALPLKKWINKELNNKKYD